MSRAVAFWVAILMLVAGVTALSFAFRAGSEYGHFGSSGSIDQEYLKAPDLKGVEWLKEFTLTERSGKKLSSRDLLGKPYIASFFYTSCPTECLRQNGKMQELVREFKGTDFVFLSISCDPETDNPLRLREYAEKFDAGKYPWYFLTGDLEYLKKIAAELYFVPLDKQSHTERFIAVDRNGKIRKQFAWKEPAQMTELRRVMKELLAEEAKPLEEPPQPMPPPEDAPVKPAEAAGKSEE